MNVEFGCDAIVDGKPLLQGFMPLAFICHVVVIVSSEAATISAIASQQLLPKPGFDALLDLVESAGLYGLNVAHSGSVVGLLLEQGLMLLARRFSWQEK